MGTYTKQFTYSRIEATAIKIDIVVVQVVVDDAKTSRVGIALGKGRINFFYRALEEHHNARRYLGTVQRV